MDYIGKYGEYRVLAKLLELGIEAYPAVMVNQTDYDITAILNDLRVVRIQVKTTELGNQSTNNSLNGIERKYDILVVVIVEKVRSTVGEEISKTPPECAVPEEYRARFFVLTRDEALAEKGTSKLLGVSCQRARESVVKATISRYEDLWRKISAGASAGF